MRGASHRARRAEPSAHVAQTPRTSGATCRAKFARRVRRALAVVLFALASGSAGAATIHVTTGADGAPADDGQCTLREAVLLAREFPANDDCGVASGADDEIVFDVATVSPTLGAMQFTTNVTFTGPVTIDGSANGGERLFAFAAAGHMTLDGVTVTGFDAATVGGGAISATTGSLTIRNCAFNNNKTQGDGGVLDFSGDALTIDAPTTFADNQAQHDGGALRVSPSVAFTVNGAVDFTHNVAGNNGGAIFIAGVGSLATVRIVGATFTLNQADGDGSTGNSVGGGAIFNQGGGSTSSLILIEGATFTLNTAPLGRGGALLNAPTGVLTWPAQVNNLAELHQGGLYNCFFFQNQAAGSGDGGLNGAGGAIYNAGELTVLGSTFAQNVSVAASGGALAHNRGATVESERLRVVNSTFSDNAAAAQGANIANLHAAGRVSLLHVTLRGGALTNANNGADAVRLGNTLLADAPGGVNCAGQPVTDLGGNVQFPGSSCGASIPTGDPQLQPLTPNPPPLAPTMALGPTSAALEVGDAALCSAAPVFGVDQRLLPRPQGGPDCDAGAYESPNPAPQPGYGSNPAPGTALVDIVTPVNVAGASTLTVTETGNALLDVTSVSVVGAAELSVSPPSFAIADGGAAVTVTVQCLSAVSGTFQGTLTLQHNAPGSPATYAVNCTVTNAGLPGYGSLPTSGAALAPVATTVNVAGATTLSVMETGSAALDVTSVTVTGSPELTVTPPAFTIADGGPAMTVTVQCLSGTLGVFSGTLTLVHNAAGSPATYPVSCVVGALGQRGDLDGDQRPDLVFRNSGTGAVSVWAMDGLTRLAELATTPSALADVNWRLQGTADFNGDGHTDLLWRHAASGKLVVWLMNNLTRTTGVFLTPDTLADPNWQIAGTGHFNGDGKVDILWRNSVSGRNVVWTMNDTVRLQGAFTTPDTLSTAWQVAGTGDFNGDQKTDILWQRASDGETNVWFMDGTTRLGEAPLNPQLAAASRPGWRVFAVEDYDGNGRPDLVWRNIASGRLVMWFMDATGVNRLSGGFTTPVNVLPLDWTIVGPR